MDTYRIPFFGIGLFSLFSEYVFFFCSNKRRDTYPFRAREGIGIPFFANASHEKGYGVSLRKESFFLFSYAQKKRPISIFLGYVSYPFLWDTYFFGIGLLSLFSGYVFFLCSNKRNKRRDTSPFEETLSGIPYFAKGEKEKSIKG